MENNKSKRPSVAWIKSKFFAQGVTALTDEDVAALLAYHQSCYDRLVAVKEIIDTPRGKNGLVIAKIKQIRDLLEDVQ